MNQQADVATRMSKAETTRQLRQLEESIESVIRGKREVVRLALMTLLAGGHLLIEDVPGVGKTTLAQAMAKSFDCSFQRIQFTSDLLPSDIVGLNVFNQQNNQFEFRPGPIFANVILADEINRTTPKTQSCLLEAMSEGRVTVENRTFHLPQPFIVLATQNPVEHHGTYPLPESQLDRFLVRLRIGYPDAKEEKQILLSQMQVHPIEALTSVMHSDQVVHFQEITRNIQVDDTLVDYLLRIINATRESELLELGVSPRGSLALFRAAQAMAVLDGRDFCLPDDIKQIAIPVLSHRVMINPHYSSGRRQTDEAESALEEILKGVAVPV